MKSHSFASALVATLLFVAGVATTASGQTLRIAAYNVNADTSSSGSGIGSVDGGAGLVDVLEAMGQAHLSDGKAQPLDVLALEELHYDNPTISQTLTYITSQLNAFYGAGTYAYDTRVDATTGDLTGNGPSGLIYNTHTVVDLGSAQVGSASGSGAPRAPMRYSLKPVGGAAYTQFYLYVSHAKSGTDTSSTPTDAQRRNTEATALRSNAAGLTDFDGLKYPHIIYTGDFNIENSGEQAYQTMIAPSSPVTNPGQAIDAANPTNDWAEGSNATLYSRFWPLISEKATGLQYRDDLQLITAPVQSMPGLQLVAGTITPFGNNGSVGYGSTKSVTSGSNTALSDLPNRSTILSDLTTATDHLPIIADYTIVPPGDLNRDGHVNAADIPAMLTALANIPAYETAVGFTGTDKDNQMMEIGDVNGDKVFNNADIQALENFLIAGNGTDSAVPEPASIVLFALAMPVFLWLLGRRQLIVA